MAISKAERKDWARAHFKGYENIFMPSFTPDLKALDEEGIRHDVRQSLKHGCFSVFAVPLGLAPHEEKQFLEIIVDEVQGRMSVGLPIMAPTLEDCLGELQMAEAVGCTHALIHPAHTFHADTTDDLYKYYRTLIDSTNLGVALWATDGQQFANLHPSNVVVDVYSKLADLPNVVALKLMTTLELPTVFELCEKMHKKVLIGGVHLGLMPFLAKHYGMQWSGAWTIEALQSPERPYMVEYMQHLQAGRFDEAAKVYWHVKPGYNALFQLMSPMLPKGVHPFTHLKYYQWCTGGNGGLLRDPWDPNEKDFPLNPAERTAMKAGYRTIGIEPRADSDECFVVGAAAYARGVRAKDMPYKATYVE